MHEQGCELWLQRRQETGRLAGKWEFPGGKIEAGESPPVSGARELEEETGFAVSQDKLIPFKNYTYEYPDRTVLLHVHLLYFSPQSEYLESLEESGWKRFSWKEPFSLEWTKEIPEANQEILKDLAGYLAENYNQEHWRGHWQQLSC